MYFLSLDESDSLNHESEKLGSDSGSFGTYSFRYSSFPDEVSVAGDFGSEIFASTGVKS